MMNISSLNVFFFTIDLLKNDNVNLARNVSPLKWYIFWVLAPYSRSEFSVYLFLPPVNKNSPKLCNHFNFGNMPQRRHLNVEELSRGIGMLQGGLSQRRVLLSLLSAKVLSLGPGGDSGNAVVQEGDMAVVGKGQQHIDRTVISLPPQQEVDVQMQHPFNRLSRMLLESLCLLRQ